MSRSPFAISSSIGSTVDRRAVGIGFVDVLLLTGLLAYGSWTHGVDPLRNPIAVLETATPFLIGWVIVAVVAGCYAADVVGTPSRAVRVTAVAWLAAANVGLILRSSPAFHGGATWPFGLVVTGSGLLVLGTWRLLFARFAGSRDGDRS